jgi:hypothetical protein
MDIAHKTDKMVKWKVSLCDEADFLVSTFEVEAFSSHSALMMALLKLIRNWISDVWLS